MAVELREIPVPEIGDTDVLLRVGAVSVCGSDIHQAHNTHSWPVNIPVVLGHEFGGTIAALGREVRGVKEGDRVVSETAAVICGNCMMCRTGRYNLCPTRKGFGYGVNGAMAQYVKVPARCLHAHSRQPAVRIRVPRRAALRRVSVDVRQFDDPAGRRGRRARARTDRPAVHAHGGAVGRASAGRGRPDRRQAAPRSGARARRDARRRRAEGIARRGRALRSIRSARNWSATRPARAVRSTWR